VTHDDRFIISTVTPSATEGSPIQVLLNWQQLLKR
jgi:hypothetical protein